MAELGVSFLLPEGWAERADFSYRAFFSPEGDRELDFWLLEGEFDEGLASLQAREAARAYRNLETLPWNGAQCLIYVDEADQFCANFPCGKTGALYMSLSDNGAGDALFREIAQSVALLPAESEPALIRAQEADAQPVLKRALSTPAPRLERAATPTPSLAPAAKPRPTANIDLSTCGVCGGTGRCYPCLGRGWRYAHGDRVTCAACKGTGECRTCGGDGKR